MRKRRTREHVIADLSVNHVERFVLRAGHVADRGFFDYGYDLTVRTFSHNGEVERDFFYIQLKASDVPRYVDSGRSVSVSVAEGDLQLWRKERVPVVLVFYDSAADVAFWGHIQEIANSISGVTVRLEVAQKFNEEAVELLRQRKNTII
jgi:hypothetical protein